MSSWEKYYSEKTLLIHEAIEHIKPQRNILIPGFCSEPIDLVDQLINQKKRLIHSNIFTLVQGGSCKYATHENAKYFKVHTFLAAPQLKSAFLSGSSDYIPTNMSGIPRWLSENRIDAVLVQVSPPDKEGYCSLGISVDFMKTAIQFGGLVIAEVNKHMPQTFGDTKVHVKEINWFVLSDHPLNTIDIKEASETEKQIGRNVAELIPHRATFQIGIGSIAESILESLEGKVDLGVHSGTYSDKMIDLIESGTVTNRYKNIRPGIITSTSVTGTQKIYDYVNENDFVELYSVDYTHHPKTISEIENFYSINSALEVDITGQVNAERLGKLQIAGVGGQMDFIQGSKWSKGGRSIIALPSTAKNDTISRISFKAAAVTTLKTEVDYLVTEYGVAKLFGKSLRARVHEISAIAHPDFRKELMDTL